MAVVRIPEHVLFQTIGAETCLVNLHTGQYHGLNETGGRMLAVLADVGDTEQAVAVIAEEYGRPPGEVARDMDELLASLAERSLLQLTDT